MADVRIPLQRFRDRDFPSLCAVTGLPAADIYAFTFGGVDGGLPLSAATTRLVRQQQLTLKILAALTLFIFLLAAATKSALLGFGAAGTAAIVLANFTTIRARLPRGTVDGKHLLLTNVHRVFAETLTTGVAPGKCAGCPSTGACADQHAESPAGV